MVIRAAVATDDGEKLIDRHFGDAQYYHVYEVEDGVCRFLRRIENSSDEERAGVHADPEKARSVSAVLMSEGVNTVVSRIFGPNIKRIRRKFVCVVVDDIPVSSVAGLLKEHTEDIEAEWKKGEERKHLRISS